MEIEPVINRSKWKRNDVVGNVIDFEEAQKEQSQRQFALEHNIPRTTLQHWLKRKNNIDSSPAVIDFFESPDGLAFLHRLTTAALFAFTKKGVGSTYNVSTFLELSGLAPFVASSRTTQSRASNKMDDLIIEFGKAEQERLGPMMRAKKISLASDETFHPDICLVSMEPVSNFILVEKYVEHRDGNTWNSAVEQALENLPVKVIQVASDEGTGLLNHIGKGLNAHHSSDFFHVSYEIGKGSSGALAAAIKKSDKKLEVASKQVEKAQKEKDKFDSLSKRPRGRRPNFEKNISEVIEQKIQAQAEQDEAIENQQQVSLARAEMGEVYHPYNIETGVKQGSDKVSERLELCFDRINEGTKHLSGTCRKRIDKAHRVVKNLVSTVAFFFCMIEVYMDNIQLSDDEKKLMHQYLIPGFYLLSVAEKERDPEKKGPILKKSQELLLELERPTGAFSGYSEIEIERLKKGATECAQIFQRSSSCVEGRNAQLSLRHHGLHRLSDRCLQAQTVIHNFYTTNKQGKTPALRFFEAKHNDLFEWLLGQMDYSARPRKPRLKAA